MAPPPSYKVACAFAAEGARVGLVTCLRCGAALLVDPWDRFDVLRLHEQWHASQEVTGGLREEVSDER